MAEGLLEAWYCVRVRSIHTDRYITVSEDYRPRLRRASPGCDALSFLVHEPKVTD